MSYNKKRQYNLAIFDLDGTLKFCCVLKHINSKETKNKIIKKRKT